MKKLLLVVAVLCCVISAGYSQEKVRGEEFISKAAAHLKSIGYHFESLGPVYDGAKEKWHSWWESRKVNFPNLPDDDPDLIERNYEVVYFSPSPGPGLRGAGIWVFIDGDTKGIIKVAEDPN